jgi:hypothetical protein
MLTGRRQQHFSEVLKLRFVQVPLFWFATIVPHTVNGINIKVFLFDRPRDNSGK